MALNSNDLRLFGVDLSQVWTAFSEPFRQMDQWLGLRWLTPQLPIRLLMADGREILWVEGVTENAAPGLTSSGAVKADFLAVELAPDRYLVRELQLPRMVDGDLLDALALEAQGASPFPASDLAWGYATRSDRGEGSQVSLVMTSRRQLEAVLGEQTADLAGAAVLPEVWALVPHGDTLTPVIIRGYGEARRQTRTVAGRRVRVCLLVLAAVLGLGLAVTPTVQLRERAVAAVEQFREVQKRAAPSLGLRDKLVEEGDRLKDLSELLQDRVEPLRVMDLLTQALPDDTSLLTLQVQGTKVTMSGQTANSAALMQKLSAESLFKDVKAPAPAVKPLGAVKESFTIELNVDVKAMRANDPPPAVPNVVAPPAAAPAAIPPTSVSPAAAPVPAVAVPTGAVSSSAGSASPKVQPTPPMTPPVSASGAPVGSVPGAPPGPPVNPPVGSASAPVADKAPAPPAEKSPFSIGGGK